MKLGIIGHGFVGSAVDHAFIRDCKKFIIDPKHSNNSVGDLCEFNPEAVFIAVPTPQLSSGEADVSILLDVLGQLNKNKGCIVLIKSTVPSYHLSEFEKNYKNLRIVYNPEFLTEKNYIEDFRNPVMQVFGGNSEDTKWAETIYKKHSVCKECPVFHTDLVTASFIKYTINSFLATKVTFFNELYDVFIRAGGKDFSKFTEMVSTDPRMGNSHMQVPGKDGQRGYGGSCFPKDTAALAYFAREILGKPFTQLETSININDHLRKLNNS
jgi:nucleotide sugar dehydrogenase